jgi:hypothetical protein
MKELDVDKRLEEMRKEYERAHQTTRPEYTYNYGSGQYEQKPPFGWGQ